MPIELNEEQTRAVEHPPGSPAVLIAGAGSGKTACLQGRVIWLIKGGVPPEKILVVTFTNKATDEVKARILSALPGVPQARYPHVSTIHSLALSYIRKAPGAFGLRNKVTPLDDRGQERMLKKIIDDLVAKGEERYDLVNPWRLLEKVGFHRARGMGFAIEYTPDYNRRALAAHGGYHAMGEDELAIWRLYEARKTMDGVVDFDDMLHLCIRRARTDAAWLAEAGRRFGHVLVDEVQDLSKVQWEFIEAHLAPGNPNFYCVGDMNQSIYAFNGASPDILRRYSEGWRGAVPAMYRIERNHRSCPEIVRLANAISRRMTETIPLQMVSWRGLAGERGTTKLTQAASPAALAEIMAREIYLGANRTQPPIPYGNNAILVRSATQIRDIEGELVKYRIPYIVRGGKGLLGTEEVRDVVAFLQLAVNPHDFEAFSRAAGLIRGVGEATLRKVSGIASASKADLLDAAYTLGPFQGFVLAMQAVRKAPDPWEAYGAVLADAGYLARLKEKYGKDAERLESKVGNLGRLSALIRSLTLEGASLDDVVFRLALEPPRDDPQGRVVVSTMHAAKGLEWQRVYVANLYEGSLPHQFSMGNASEIEEERRLLYVACTRARDNLVLCVPDTVQAPGGPVRRVAVSRFLRELNILPS